MGTDSHEDARGVVNMDDKVGRCGSSDAINGGS